MEESEKLEAVKACMDRVVHIADGGGHVDVGIAQEHPCDGFRYNPEEIKAFLDCSKKEDFISLPMGTEGTDMYLTSGEVTALYLRASRLLSSTAWTDSRLHI